MSKRILEPSYHVIRLPVWSVDNAALPPLLEYRHLEHQLESFITGLRRDCNCDGNEQDRLVKVHEWENLTTETLEGLTADGDFVCYALRWQTAVTIHSDGTPFTWRINQVLLFAKEVAQNDRCFLAFGYPSLCAEAKRMSGERMGSRLAYFSLFGFREIATVSPRQEKKELVVLAMGLSKELLQRLVLAVHAIRSEAQAKLVLWSLGCEVVEDAYQKFVDKVWELDTSVPLDAEKSVECTALKSATVAVIGDRAAHLAFMAGALQVPVVYEATSIRCMDAGVEVNRASGRELVRSESSGARKDALVGDIAWACSVAQSSPLPACAVVKIGPNHEAIAHEYRRWFQSVGKFCDICMEVAKLLEPSTKLQVVCWIPGLVANTVTFADEPLCVLLNGKRDEVPACDLTRTVFLLDANDAERQQMVAKAGAEAVCLFRFRGSLDEVCAPWEKHLESLGNSYALLGNLGNSCTRRGPGYRIGLYRAQTIVKAQE